MLGYGIESRVGFPHAHIFAIWMGTVAASGSTSTGVLSCRVIAVSPRFKRPVQQPWIFKLIMLPFPASAMPVL